MVKARAISRGLVGKCVYCGRKDKPLTEEHILAAGLGGLHTLQRASCPDCQKIINEQVEEPLLRLAWRDFRYRNGIGIRRKNRRPLKTFVSQTFSATEPDLKWQGASWPKIELKFEDVPAFITLPLMREAGYLRGLSPLEVLKESNLAIWTYMDKTNRPFLEKEHLLVESRFNSALFVRLLAKTAHCATVAHLGIDNFTPFLTDLILGRDDDKRWYFAGCLRELKPASNSVYDLDVHLIQEGPLAGTILSDVRIFADRGSPTYRLVVGIKKN